MERRPSRKAAASTSARVLVGATALVLVAGARQASEWSAPVNLGPIVNSTSSESGPFISRDGLSLYFGSTRPGGSGGFDLYVSQRAGADKPWGTPRNLGPTINSASNEQTPTLSPDGQRLFFISDRPGGLGGLDLYASRRAVKGDDLSWRPPENLGSGVNSSVLDSGPTLFEDAKTAAVTLYFSSTRPGGPGGDDIYVSTLKPDGTFGAAVLVPELSSPARDLRPAIRSDGLELFLDSDRPGTIGGLDLWLSTRRSTSDPWSAPVNLGPVVNTAAQEVRPAISADGTVLYFHSGPAVEAFDLYVSTRTKPRQPE